MITLRSAQFFLLAFTLLAIALVTPRAQAGTIYTVKNPNAGPLTLSDLIVYGSEAGQRKVILQPGLGEDESADDVVLAGGGTFTSGDAGFEITKAMISTKPNADSEVRSVISNIEQKGPKNAAWLDDPALILALDYTLVFDIPAAGTAINFIDGFNSELPGWFVATQLDLDSGEVSQAFTGTATIFTVVEAAAVPEPSSLLLFGAAVCGFFGRRVKARIPTYTPRTV